MSSRILNEDEDWRDYYNYHTPLPPKKRAEKKIYDISFAGSSITINDKEINDFIDDANPIDVQDTELCNIEWGCNGGMVRTIKPSAVLISVTVLPGSESDDYLHGLWEERFSNGGEVDEEKANSSISLSASFESVGEKYDFSGGTMISGAAAISSNGNGKLGGNTYTFCFPTVV